MWGVNLAKSNPTVPDPPPSPSRPHLLLAEDDPALRRMLRLNFELEGYHVVEAADGPSALEAVRTRRIDCAVLDIMMPKLDGLAVCTTLRLEGHRTPILFLTARNAGPDRVEGLRTGADDYLGKPFELEELLLRVKRLLALPDASPAPEVTQFLFGKGCRIDFAAYRIVTCTGEERAISKREAMLLRLLTSRAGEVVSREEILEKVWGYDVYPSTRTVDNFILGFRKYFEPNPPHPVHFFSVRGVGYRFSL